MRVPIMMTDEFKETPVFILEKYGGKTYNIVRRAGCETMEDVVKNMNIIRQKKGYGAKTEKALTNAIVDVMISTLTDKQRVEWFLQLVEKNEPEDLKDIAEGFKAKIEEVA